MKLKKLICFIGLIILLIGLFFISINTGSIKVSLAELFKGLFIEYNESVAIIYDLRFPRIFISIIAGASLAVSGVLFQAVLRNPLADPSIIGISSCASFVSVIIIAFFPNLFLLTPIFAFIGGFIACIIVYSLSWENGFSPLRIVLVGVAVNSIFNGLLQGFESITSGSRSSVTAIVNANVSLKTWSDVKLLSIYVAIGLILACFMVKKCNLLALEDKTVRGLGINVTALRFIVSIIAVLLASITTAVVGTISFIGLIVPHIGRLMVGSDHKVLVPFSMLLGAFIMLLADTVGRAIAYPYEISASIIMAIIGAPFFIILLKRSRSGYAS